MTSLEPSAIVDKDLIPLTRRLEAGADVFRREFSAIDASLFVEWPDYGAYTGGWLVFPLVWETADVPETFELERNRALCPRSSRLLEHEGIRAAGVSRLLPGCRILPHGDLPMPGVLRYHLGLDVPPDAALVLGETEIRLAGGRAVLFDHSMVHSAHNLGAGPRDVLIVDYEVSEDESAALRASRQGVNLGPCSG